MSIIDRTSQGSSKSTVNRSKFMRRYKDAIKESVRKAVGGRSIKDMENGHDVDISGKSITEPFVGTGSEGVHDYVVPGNESYDKGDRFRRKYEGQGKGKNGSNAPDVFEEDFVFSLSKEEFMDIFFEDLALPNLVKESLHNIDDTKFVRAGYKKDGAASSLDVVQTMKNSIARRIGTSGSSKEKIKKLQEEIEERNLMGIYCRDLEEQISALKHSAPFLDPLDLKYTNHAELDNPGKTAVMFACMDVSGSMGEREKDIAKRFFILLYLFLTRSHKNVEVVFIKHHTEAFEVSEEDFFHAREAGGTVVSSALEMIAKIIKERYPEDEYNIYVSQCSDGDNYNSDNDLCKKILEDSILPFTQYYTYLEITEADGRTDSLWDMFRSLERKYTNFAMEFAADATDIYPVFRYLFKRP